ncbi:SixA phosphatase family protein [Pedobacter heparinus]|uniref:Phosphoglycerate mutase n=1 Tax=Pedobacter heparinus (strain ATCC 13125 / DSM 2366 / CIP 104194 / JCM 7457 / NBRC 12017 / NCIMB 9290 / NRRL B-14731 / HIM 762-3) TaxID=485917 RepID=C6Y350_PEDHD|nr:histidine phosphatase family protein [Pedobacter heparinus]ACU05275.1 Phosphoglycerate mutase [Pedobacter heparinus DSM 2366]
MAKKLLLVRHGKSEWGNAHLADFDRPLNPRGHRNAPEMAARLLQKDLVPHLIVSSPALRAITTAKHFAQAWKKSAEQIKEEASIYEANVKTLLKVINRFNNRYDYIAIFGHNPGFTDLANYLSDTDIYNIPTCGTVLIEFPFDEWELVSHHTGRLLQFDYPKSLNED